MKLRELLSGVNFRIASGDLNTEIFGLAYDSRQVSPDYLFVAIRGSRLDGNRFIPKAIAKGAAAVVSALPPVDSLAMPWIQTDDERAALGTPALSACAEAAPAREACARGGAGSRSHSDRPARARPTRRGCSDRVLSRWHRGRGPTLWSRS